jgi:hypothetical protein
MFKRFLHSADQQLDFTSVKAGLAKVEVLRADLTTMRRELRREKTTHRLNALKRELSPGRIGIRVRNVAG